MIDLKHGLAAKNVKLRTPAYPQHFFCQSTTLLYNRNNDNCLSAKTMKCLQEVPDN